MATIELTSATSEVQVKCGDKLTYAYNEHISVGYTADFEIEDSGILKHSETNTVYRHPEKMKEGMTGGDSASTTFVFEAQATGTTLLIIHKYFRFELEEEYTFRVNVI